MGQQSEHSKADKDQWPELQPVRRSLTPEQAFALEKVRRQAENANTYLRKRSGAVLAVIIVSLFSTGLSALHLIPQVLSDDTGGVNLFLALSMVLQLATAGYFLRAKDPLLAAQVVRFMLIMNALVIYLGFSWLGMAPLSLLLLVVMFAAYRQLEQLKNE